ncbi:glycerol-3-phosphate dehydrogenase [NAD(+)], cytoplasmic-like [Oppia nitens]|uniref:glycerol-3-phosphate dehydrogenase [NAD(+)], cytoplasmic-like n=1 Tax=Oppia nitens TaxID=1686743 RepID=UPI0023DC58AF|nr:glycerol-3-phosphate dehydrogenase [NAD(+)], cytoplasmic-like [Oppia nitens]
MSSIIDKTRAVISTDNHQNDCSRRKSISVLGGGAWGTAIADLIGHNVTLNKHLFHEEVIFYVRDEHLRLIIEKTRQNIRYLSAIKLPPNVKPVTSLSDAVTNCDIIIFVIPHQYIHSLCLQINDSIVSTRNPIGISLIKGIHVDNVNNLELTSQIINRMLGIEVGVLSGANIAIEVAQRQYSEATIVNPVTDNNNWEPILRSLFECNHFKVSFCKDGPTVEICGALKNVVAIGCGLSDGLGFGMNTKAAVLSCGLKEMIKFVQLFHPNYQLSTFFENCGIADTIASSFGGRNRRVSEALINSNKSIDLLERQLLGGQKLQGPHTAHVVHKLLEHKNLSKDFPFFTSIYRICNRSMNPKDFINSIQTRH